MTISVNEQVSGHKVTVAPAARVHSGQRRDSCQCGWESGIGSTKPVMAQIRSHLETALAASQRREGPTKPGFGSFRR